LERPAWKRLVADAQAGKFDAVVVTYMSRLARSPKYHVAEYLLTEAGIDIITVEEQFGNDLHGQINKEVTILADGLQPKQAAMHTRTKMEGMVAAGYGCGHIPFGYRKEFVKVAAALSAEKEPPQIMLPHPDEAPIVRQAFSMAKARHTRADIRDYLRMVTGRDSWHATDVKKMLTEGVGAPGMFKGHLLGVMREKGGSQRRILRHFRMIGSTEERKIFVIESVRIGMLYQTR